ncbi:MAG: hypothetical protein JSR33_06600, partial [Proteobacteria bacterium]|nr:hypothetical protein [Pseudomonadota bacterium]
MFFDLPTTVKPKDEQKDSSLKDLKGLEKELTPLLMEAFDRAGALRGKDIIMVIGSTGSGKSTTVSYQIGCEMIENKYGVIDVKDTEKRRHPKIGADVKSETLYPDVFESEYGLNFGDYPGFGETGRGEAKEICAAVSTQAAIQATKSIQGIMVVIEYSSFFTQRAISLKSLVDTLSHLLVQPSSIEGSVRFIITKRDRSISEEAANNRLFHQVDQLISLFTEELGKADAEAKSISKYLNPFKIAGKIIKEALFSEEMQKKEKQYAELQSLQARLEVLKLIKRSNTNFVNPLDHGESRSLIASILTDSNLKPKPVNKDQFRFTLKDTAHVKFKHLILKIARNGYQVVGNILEAHSAINRCEEEIKYVKSVSQHHAESLEKLNNNRGEVIPFDEKEHSRVTQNTQIMKGLIGDCDREIKQLKFEEQKLVKKLSKHSRERESLDTDDLELHWKDSVNKSAYPWLWYTKDFVYQDIPYDDPRPGCVNGDFYNTQEDKGAGYYKSTYKSGWFKPGKAWVEIYVARKNLPANRQHITDIRMT